MHCSRIVHPLVLSFSACMCWRLDRAYLGTAISFASNSRRSYGVPYLNPRNRRQYLETLENGSRTAPFTEQWSRSFISPLRELLSETFLGITEDLEDIRVLRFQRGGVNCSFSVRFKETLERGELFIKTALANLNWFRLLGTRGVELGTVVREWC